MRLYLFHLGRRPDEASEHIIIITDLSSFIMTMRSVRKQIILFSFGYRADVSRIRRRRVINISEIARR